MGARISAIAALGRNGVIGIGNKLPWHLPEDLKRFKRLTSGHPIIAGRKTFESFGRPLPNRLNLVITRSLDAKFEGAETFGSLGSALARAREVDQEEIFIVGGEEIYRLAMPLVDRLYLTFIDQDFEGDARFPQWPESEFHKKEEETREGPPRYVWVTLDRR